MVWNSRHIKEGFGGLCACQKCNTCPDEHDPCWASLVCITMTVIRCMYMSHTQHTHTHTHKHIHTGTHTHTHTPHYNMFEHMTLIQLILSQRWAEKSKVLGWISSYDLNSQPCVVWLCLGLLCSSVYVACMYPCVVLLCLVLLCWRGPTFSNYQIVHGLPPPPFFHYDCLECSC